MNNMSKRETFTNVFNRVPSRLLLAHGAYMTPPSDTFIVPSDTFYVFIGRPNTVLPKAVINDEFYEIFTNPRKMKSLLTTNRTSYYERIKTRVYGPGETVRNIKFFLEDPDYEMGMFGLPLFAPLNKGQTFPGFKYFDSLREYNDSGLGRKSITFIVSCRTSSHRWNNVANTTARSLSKRVRVSTRGLPARKIPRTLNTTSMLINRSPKRIYTIPITRRLKTRVRPRIRTRTLIKKKISK